MRLTRLEVSNVRNLEQVALEPGPGLNLLYGDNGAGKTALLEAVHLLGRGRSFRTHRIRQVIRRGEDQSLVRAELELSRGQSSQLALQRSLTTGVQLRVDGHPVSKLSEIAARLPLQVMLPDVSDLVFGSPTERRQFLDWGMFHVKHQYHGLLRDYLRVLKQRNAWLRSQMEGSKGNDPWIHQFVELAGGLDSMRKEYISHLSDALIEAAASLGMDLDLELKYAQGWREGVSPKELVNVLAEQLPREVKLGATQSGPHRADLVIRALGAVAAQQVSRGQGKVISSALNIAQARLLNELTERTSVFLIDDLGAELDRTRSHHLYRLLADMGCQVFATAVEPPRDIEAFSDHLTLFHVKQGAIRRIEE